MLSFGFAFGSFVPFHLCFRFFTQMDPEAFWPHEGVLFMMKQEVVKRGCAGGTSEPLLALLLPLVLDRLCIEYRHGSSTSLTQALVVPWRRGIGSKLFCGSFPMHGSEMPHAAGASAHRVLQVPRVARHAAPSLDTERRGDLQRDTHIRAHGRN